MSGDSNKARLAELLAQCVAELLAELGVQAERLTGVRQPPPDGKSIAAFSGFSSDELRGSFTFLAASALFSRLHPLPLTATPRDLTDWACELVNQSIGRLRNRLLAYGVKLTPSIPQSVLAKELLLSSSLQPGRTPISFAMDGMVLESWLELDIEPGFLLAERPFDEGGAALREGSLVLF